MNTHIHGFISWILLGVMFGIALAVLFNASVLLGVLYAAILFVCVIIVIYSYCGKCLCRNEACSHFLPGMITGLLPYRKQGPYSFGDYMGTVIPILLIIGFPQYWLCQARPAFIAFWIVAALAALDIKLVICPSCGNRNCPLCGSSAAQ